MKEYFCKWLENRKMKEINDKQRPKESTKTSLN